MAIDLVEEKNKVLSTQEMYEIMDFATQAAEDNGFMNSFIYQRALYLFAAIRFYEDRREEIANLVAENVNTAWDTLLEDSTLEDMAEQYAADLEMLAENGEIWFKEFTEYAHSARGLLNTIQEFTGDIVKQAAAQLQTTAEDPRIQEVLNIAETWGMNNNPQDVIQEVISEEDGSLFQD